MKKIVLHLTLTTVMLAMAVSAVASSSAFEKANFSGTWKLDAAKSEGLPPGMDQVMTVTQTDDKITLQTKIITEEGEQAVDDGYVVSGQAVDFAPKSGGGATGKGKRTAKWTADGNGIEVNEEAEFETPDGAVKIHMNRKWLLASDGKTLTIELTYKGPNSVNTSKRTFVKKA